MSDLIDRRAAIDEIKALYEWHDTVTEDRTIDHLKRLPSAEPEIIYCKDCKYGKQDEDGVWYCINLGCQMGDKDGNGFCSDAERKENE